MKEPWKKTGDGEQQQKAGKVVITLNDETKSEPTEVEMPVDLNWTHRRERKCSTPKVVVLVGVVLLLGLTVITLFKVQNLIYSTSYINWRMQEIESAVKDSNEDITMMKFKMSLDARDEAILAARAARAEPLIAAMASSKNLDSQDLKLSESQNQNHKLTNSLTSESVEAKDMKDSEVQSSKGVEPETSKDAKSKDTTGEDGKDHPNPADPEEWIKPLVETFDILGNQPVEDQFIQNVLMKLLMPENNFEVLEFKKIREGENSVAQEMDNQREVMSPMRNNEEQINKPLPFPLENILMKTLLPPISNFKVFHFNEKTEPQTEEDMSQKMLPIQSLKMKPMLPPPIEGLVKSLLPPTSNMKIFRLNDNRPQEQSAEEDIPKITIQSIKLKLIPLPPQEEFGVRRDSPANLLGNGINGIGNSINNNFEMIRMNESPEPSQKVEAPKMQYNPQFGPFLPFPIQEIMRSILPTSKHIEIIPLNEKPEDRQMQQQQQDRDIEMNQQEKFPQPFPLDDLILKTLLTAPAQNSEEQYSKESLEQQQQQNPQVEVTKIPVHTIKLTSFHHPLQEGLMKPVYDASIHPYEDDEDADQQEQQQQPLDHMQMQPQQPMDHMQMQQQPQQPMDHMQMQQQQPQPIDHMQMQPQQQQPFEFIQMQQQQQIPQEPHQQQQLPEVPRPIVRSTKLNPVESWNMSPSPQPPKEPVQEN